MKVPSFAARGSAALTTHDSRLAIHILRPILKFDLVALFAFLAWAGLLARHFDAGCRFSEAW